MTTYRPCGECGTLYRTDSVQATEAHESIRGHTPRPAEAPSTHEVPPSSAADLLLAAAERIGELQKVLAVLGELADTWDRTGHPERAAELRGVLARPAVRPLGEEDTDV